MTHRAWCLVLTAAAVALLPAVARGQSAGARAAGVELDVRPLAMLGRHQAPRLVEITVANHTGHVLQGQLEIAIQPATPQARVVLTLPETMFAPGEQRLSVTLPPPDITIDDGTGLPIRISLTRSDQVLATKVVDVGIPMASVRSMVIAVCADWIASPQRTSQITSRLNPAQFRPPELAQELVVLPTALLPQDLPNEALSYCQFDLLIIHGDAIAALSAQQLRSITAWVRGGGALCLLPLKTRLDELHMDFLNGLADDAHDRPFYTTSTGQVAAASDETGRAATPLRTFRSGLGRAAVLTGEDVTPASLTDREWQQLTTFLWRFTRYQALHVARQGRWATAGEIAGVDDEAPAWDRGYVDAHTLASRMLLARRDMEVLLTPDNVRLLPLSIVMGLLGCLTLMVGPGEYLALGLLRRRKWTWVVFPVCALGMTGLLIAISNHTMGRQNRGRTLQVYDVDQQGRPVRVNQFDLILTGRSQQIDRHATNALQRACPTGTDTERSWRGYDDSYELAVQEHPHYAGRFPTDYVMEQAFTQWRPQLLRQMSLTPTATWDSLNWHAVQAGDLADADRFAGIPDSLFGGPTPEGCGVMVQHMGQSVVAAWECRTRIHLTVDLATETTFGHQRRLFQVVQQISPDGGAYLEDMTIADATDPADYVLLVLREAGDQLEVYRKVYRLSQPAGGPTP